MGRGTDLGTLEDIVRFLAANELGGNTQEGHLVDWIHKKRGIGERGIKKALQTLKQAGILRKEYHHLLTENGAQSITMLSLDFLEVETRHISLKIEVLKRKIEYLPEPERSGIALSIKVNLLREAAEKDRLLKRVLKSSILHTRKGETKEHNDLSNYLWNMQVDRVMEYLKAWKERGSI